MGLYEKHILPVLIDLAMRNTVLRAERARWIPKAGGEVLELGFGSGLNLAHYGEGVSSVVGVDPSRELARKAAARIGGCRKPVRLIAASGEAIPLEDESVDCVVATWTLCSIPDPAKALGEARRVLRPDGRLLFVEHGLSPDKGVARWQARLDPCWGKIGGGCHLNRPIDALIRSAGFAIPTLETGYVRGPRLVSYLYRGIARRER